MKKELETIFLNALEKNQEKLFRVCSIYSKDDEDTKDLLQEVLVHVWRSMATFKGKSSLSAFDLTDENSDNCAVDLEYLERTFFLKKI